MAGSSYAQEVLIHAVKVAPGKSGVLVSVTRTQAGWDTINFSVRRLIGGQYWQSDTHDEEAAVVLLGGRAAVNWGHGYREIGGRRDVFGGYPYALYLPCHTPFEISALTTCEFADARVPSSARLTPRIIEPADCREEIRGGGNCTRQIVDVIRPEFPAEKLLVCEVYTPSGNWSSYPPHKHDVHNPPKEVDLDETYYYRVSRPEGYAFQRLYDHAGTRDDTLTLVDGDLVLIKDGYHPVVAAHGYDVYYLNVLAGSARSMAATDDPRYAYLRNSGLERDPRVPLVHVKPTESSA
ncbi:MAG TPA: 5-deoxy-glucuronate isomerase [Candidatus Acidoferrum sp.]|jgi:5-deoxy-glucuronate isomerase|nr:5-deoxy-glucuronate isomerase [Candidatus Acidoferrum sp.]